jgi:hypothetical protein
MVARGDLSVTAAAAMKSDGRQQGEAEKLNVMVYLKVLFHDWSGGLKNEGDAGGLQSNIS